MFISVNYKQKFCYQVKSLLKKLNLGVQKSPYGPIKRHLIGHGRKLKFTVNIEHPVSLITSYPEITDSLVHVVSIESRIYTTTYYYYFYFWEMLLVKKWKYQKHTLPLYFLTFSLYIKGGYRDRFQCAERSKNYLVVP